LAKKERKRPILELVKQAVTIWEEMRPASADAAKKKDLAAQLVQLGRGHLRELSLNHSSSRAIQAVLKHGSSVCRAAVFAECKASAKELAVSQHGSHVLRKLAATGSKGELSGVFRTL
jgi:pumilio homology domain family member 6